MGCKRIKCDRLGKVFIQICYDFLDRVCFSDGIFERKRAHGAKLYRKGGEEQPAFDRSGAVAALRPAVELQKRSEDLLKLAEDACIQRINGDLAAPQRVERVVTACSFERCRKKAASKYRT